MFSLGRLSALVLAAAIAYGVFLSTPPGDPTAGAFDPAIVAADEAAVWKAAIAQEEFDVFTNCVLLVREENRYSWYRAVQAGYDLSQATSAFETMQNRFERVLPDLEDAAAVQRDWLHASYDPAAVARAQLNWWATLRMPNLNNTGDVARLMADEYALRYGIDRDGLSEAAQLRAQALELRDQGGRDPDWSGITRLLTESYRSLQTVLATHDARLADRERG